jgi:hypothetical protein
MRLFWGAVWLLTLSLGTADCARHRPIAVKPPAAPASEAFKGLTSFSILTKNPNDPRSKESEYQEIFPPRPIGELKKPVYPDKALKAKHGAAIVVVRVFIDATGQVTEIRESPAASSTGGRFAADFRSSVEDAVHQWKFQPAEHRQYEDGKDLNGDGKPDYMRVTETKQVPVYFDVRFDFSIVKGVGRVEPK